MPQAAFDTDGRVRDLLVGPRSFAQSWPVENTVYRKLYLDPAAGALVDTSPAQEAVARYDGRIGQAGFTYTFAEDTEVTGFLKLKVWVEAEGSDDLDLFVAAVKLGGPVPLPVAAGQQRASVRELDKRSTDWLPVHSMRAAEPLAEGEVVPVEISLRVGFLLFRAGEQLRLDISGDPGIVPTPGTAPRQTLADTDSSNTGTHVIRSGGERDSYLQIPTLPAS